MHHIQHRCELRPVLVRWCGGKAGARSFRRMLGSHSEQLLLAQGGGRSVAEHLASAGSSEGGHCV